MQIVALIFVVGYALALHVYLSLVATAVASLADLTISQWSLASLLGSFFVLAGIIFSATTWKELVIDASETPVISHNKKAERSAGSSGEDGRRTSSISDRSVPFAKCALLSLISNFDGGTILLLCGIHNVAIWLVVGVLTAWLDFEIALVCALIASVGITLVTRTVREMGAW